MESIDPANHVNQPTALRLIACPHPLSIEKGRIDRQVPEGATIAEHLRAIGMQPKGLTALVFIDEQRIPAAQWEYAVPKAGQSLSVRVIPAAGGGGSEQGKSALRIVAMLAVVVASIVTMNPAGPGLAGSLLSLNAGFSIGGALAVQSVAGAALSIFGSLHANTLLPARQS